MRQRAAARADLETIVAMFADDQLGKTREDASLPLNSRYTDAFAALDGDPNQYLLVGESDGIIVAYLQISFMQHLSRLGSSRGQVESVRVRSDLRGQGIGKLLMQESIRLCRERGCSLGFSFEDHTPRHEPDGCGATRSLEEALPRSSET